MYRIIKKALLAPQIYLMDIYAPRVAKSAYPGQFIIIKVDDKGERIPLTICDYDRSRGTVTIVFQTIGNSTKQMAEYNEGDYAKDFVGPLGRPSELIDEPVEALKNKKILFIAGGVGAAPVYPQVKWLNANGVKADAIIGCKSKEYLLLEEEMKKEVNKLYITTDDGSYGTKGLVTDMLKHLVIDEGKKYDLVVAIGPMIMMKFVAKATKELNIKTVASLNPIMVDGTGMCGACRVSVGGKIKFACVDGPEFDAHLIDFDEAMRRQAMYKTEEAKRQYRSKEDHEDGCGLEE